MGKQLAKYFFDQVSEKFRFLPDQYGFTGAKLRIDERIHFAFATYVGTNIAIEFVLDEREEDVTCEIARVLKEEPTFLIADTTRAGCREYLTSILHRKGVRESLFRETGRLSLDERIPLVLEDFAHALHKYCSDILSDLPTVLQTK